MRICFSSPPSRDNGWLSEWVDVVHEDRLVKRFYCGRRSDEALCRALDWLDQWDEGGAARVKLMREAA